MAHRIPPSPTHKNVVIIQFSQTEGLDMKLGLLVVLAVAVLVPSLSEGRTVSRCELKEKLGEALILPTRLQRYKEKILAIGEVNKRRVMCPEG